MEIKEFPFKSGAILRVFFTEKYCETVFPDGTKAPAIATEEQKEFAEGLGYSSAWEMVLEHEYLHNFISEIKGNPSKVLWDVAHNIPDNGKHFEEESEILELQKALNILRNGGRFRI